MAATRVTITHIYVSGKMTAKNTVLHIYVSGKMTAENFTVMAAGRRATAVHGDR
jgi:hypothetical protein